MMSRKDRILPIVQSMDRHIIDNNLNDNECNKRTIKILKQNMENSSKAPGGAFDTIDIGNCFKGILIDGDANANCKDVQIMSGGIAQNSRLKNNMEYEEEEKKKSAYRRAFCRDGINRKINLDGESHAIINLIFGLKRKSSIVYRHLCFFSVFVAFLLGFMLGIPFSYYYMTKDVKVMNKVQINDIPINQSATTMDHAIRSFRNDEMFSVKNETDDNRMFVPFKSKINYDNKIARKKDLKKSLRLNRPKKFYSVSFVDDLEKVRKDDKEENKRNISATIDSTTDTLIDMIEDSIESSLEEDNILYGNVYWGPKVEKALPAGFGPNSNREWTNYMKKTSVIKMETGCGRMQNRLVTFLDGRQACVRYRQNTDQIQGELFSFYLAQLLNLPNLVPSLISLVNLTDSLWQNVASDIGSAQWNSNRPVVMTKYISNLESAHIPDELKPSERHLNKHDILRMIKRDTSNKDDNGFLLKKISENFMMFNDSQIELVQNSIDATTEKHENDTRQENNNNNNNNNETYFENITEKIGKDKLDRLVELAQWSDLIIFDYLTANLDRVVNNLYNYQWNVNIMDAPAHNLARKVDTNLLLFLDNESGLLHGYRLLHKYEIYHSLLLDNLCLFRRSTANAIQTLQRSGNVGDILNEMFKNNNDVAIQDVLPPLPEKSVKILNERISRVAGQIKKCQEEFSAR